MTSPQQQDDKDVSELQQILGYTFTSPEYLTQAIRAAGVIQLGHLVHRDGNKRHAVVGEQVMRLVLAREAFMAGPGARTEFTQHVVSSEILDAKIAAVRENIGLRRYVKVPGATAFVSEAEVVTGLKAVIGAVFNDCENVERVKEVMEHVGIEWPSDLGRPDEIVVRFH